MFRAHNRSCPTVDHVGPVKRQTAVEGLIDAAAIIVDSIWPQARQPLDAGVLPLKDFIRETIRRSKSTFSVLQVALLYLIRIKGPLAKYVSSGSGPNFTKCDRRMFIAALILASKFLQDKNYMNRAWAKIMGVKVAEINHIEQIFLQLIDYQLFVPVAAFTRWSTLLLGYASRPPNHTTTAPHTHKNVEPQIQTKPNLSSRRSGRYCPYPSPVNTPNSNIHRRFSVDSQQEIITPQESPISCIRSPTTTKPINPLSIAFIVNPTEEASTISDSIKGVF
ncbi:PHO85 cyclin-5 [Basidiobolus ranarum]|uniref:PHO85 cyclin-5 n=1 Tax=Basidiobolus ranarum TaxID=34480 RepID=A0ABR2W2E1_9FUNG